HPYGTSPKSPVHRPLRLLYSCDREVRPPPTPSPTPPITTTAATEPLQVDTRLANRQSAQSRQAKTHLAQQILSVIRNDDFDKFLSILARQKPDLNVFIDGQTALHYCLMLGELWLLSTVWVCV